MKLIKMREIAKNPSEWQNCLTYINLSFLCILQRVVKAKNSVFVEKINVFSYGYHSGSSKTREARIS